MKKLSKRASEMLRRAGSMLLAFAVMMTGITLPNMQVQAAASDQTFYYYNDGEETPIVQMTGGVYTAKADVADYTYAEGDTSYYKMTKDEANTGWYFAAMSYDGELADGKFGVYTIPAESISGNTLISAPKCIFEGNAGADDTTEATDAAIRTAFDAGNFYYKDGVFYATMEAAMNAGSGSASGNEPGSDTEETITYEMLTLLVTEVAALKETDYTEDSWAALATALTAAQAITEANTTEEITEAYNNLKTAKDGLEKNETDTADIESTIYCYVGTDVSEVGMFYWGSGFTTTNQLADWCLWNESKTYKMTAVEGHTGWYSFPVTIAEGVSSETFGFEVCSWDGATAASVCKFDDWNNEAIWNSILAGGTVAVYNATGYASITDANVARLQDLVTEAEAYKAEDYTTDSYVKLTDAINAAKAIINAETTTDETVYSAYTTLKTAIEGLTSLVLPAEAEVYVEKINLPEGFIKGVDVSSFLSLVESGVTFKDFEGKELDDQGFFDLLAESGVNYVRFRVWNNPYDENGNGFGGGNNDLAKAVTMGKLATNAGIRVLIDFHYSDFWADPGKQKSPRAWEGMDLDTRANALSDYTKESLRTLLDAGVDVGMVQVGNETNNGIAGVTTGVTSDEVITLFKAGADAVHAIETEYEKEIDVALHFTNPESKDFVGWAGAFEEAGLKYDVFATSYYPYWHGTLDNLNSKLSDVASKYGKKVMVAETSYAYTLDDFDGHDNTVRVGSNDNSTDYSFSVQGQADLLSSVIKTVANTTNGIGVFYWEAAWLPVGVVAYDENGNPDEKQLAENKKLWEKYGSGWASSYASVYDPKDAGLWYGGSAVDNQALFDADGYPLDTLNIFKYIDSGATTEKVAIDAADVESTVNVGETYEMPATVTVSYSYGAAEDCPVVWSADDLAAVTTEKSGVYTINGTVTANDAAKTKLAVVWTLKVIPNTTNILKNGSFEDVLGTEWSIVSNNGGGVPARKAEDPYVGKYGLHFYNSKALDFTVSQKVENASAGKYTFSMNTQGAAGCNDTITAAIELTKAGETEAYATYTGNANYAGWAVWQTPTVSDVIVGEGDTITVKVSVTADGGAWGTLDNAVLSAKYFVEALETENGTVKVGADSSAAGEYVTFDVTPDEGYIAKNITVSGNGGAVDYTSTDVDGRYKFMMPSNSVTIVADFEDAAGTIDVSGNDIAVVFEDANQYDTKVVNGKTYPVYPVLKGKAVIPKITVSQMDGDKVVAKLVEGKDYTVKYANNKAASTEEKMASVTITAKAGGKCIPNTKITKYFWLEGTEIKNIANLTVNDTTTKLSKFKVAPKPFTGEAVGVTFGDDNEIAIKDGEKTLVEGTDFITIYTNNVNVGKTAQVLIIGKGNYTGSVTLKYQITKKALVEDGEVAEGIKITVPRSQTYTGSAVTPVVTVRYGANTLKAGKDYTIKYENNVKTALDDSGNVLANAKVTIKGIGNYSGKSVQYFKIQPKTIKSRSIVITEPVLTANGGEQKVPALTITFGKKKLTKNDYTVVLKDDSGNVLKKVKDAGTYTLEVTGRGNYTGTTEAALHVVEKTSLINKGKVAAIPAQTYYASEDGVTLPEGTLVVKNSKGDELTEGLDYSVSYLNNTKVGTAKVVIKGVGNYVGTIQKAFKITAKPMADSKYAEDAYPFTVSVFDRYDGSQEDAYTTSHGEVYTGKAVQPLYQVKDGDVVLTEGKDYTIKYDNNTKVTKYDEDGNVLKGATATIKGIGNYAGKMKGIKFEVRPLDISDLTITVADAVYTGKAIKPAVTFKYKGQVVNLKEKVAYTISCAHNTNALENATVTIKAKGLTDKNGIGKVVKEFTIEKGTITKASIAAVKAQSYAGKAVTPKLTVKVGKRTLKAGKDYTVIYKNNGNRGVATATVIGMGNYEGTGSVDFAIK